MCVTNRKIPTLGVTIFSVITLLLSLVMAVFAIRFNNSGLTKNLGEFDDYTNEAFLILLGASCVALVASICGLTVSCCKKKICTIIFGCVLLPAASCVLLFGFTLALVSNTDSSTLTQFCSEDPNYEAEANSKYIASARESVAELDDVMGNFVSQQMCSETCPCNAITDPTVAESWTDMSESDLNKYNRTKTGGSEYIPLNFLDANAGRSYDTFKACYEEIRSGKANVNPEIKDTYTKISNDPAF